MKSLYLRTATTALALCLATSLLAAPPPGKGGGKPGGSDKPVPDIVYLSDDGSTMALDQAAIRGIALAADGLSGSDLSLRKSKAGRDRNSVAWSPDGTRMAWIEIGLSMGSTPKSIMVGTPGSKGMAVFTSEPGDGKPQLNEGFDSLAWGPDCDDPAATVLVFPSWDPWGIFAIRIVNDQPSEPVPLMVPDEIDGLVSASAFTFSPAGQYLAFGGSVPDGSYGLWLLSMCTAEHTPFQLRQYGFVYGRPSIISADWSRWGERMALSIITGPNPGYDWRDIQIVDLDYFFGGGVEQVTFSRARMLDLDGIFTAESSEHSPQWGPSSARDLCQRIAFSQSSDIAPRSLYLLDVNNGSGSPCELDTPLQIDAKWPRALDWR
jgi:hypothetical protein